MLMGACVIYRVMFSRNFMKVFPVRKYQSITGKTNSVISDNWLLSSREINLSRPIVYLIATSVIMSLFDNFHSVDEMIGHVPRPASYTTYEAAVPANVRLPNEFVIEGFEKLARYEEINDALHYDK